MTTPASDLLDFLDRCPSPYHAVAESARRLSAEGYEEWDLTTAWGVGTAPAGHGSRGFVAQGGTVIAFHIGTRTPDRAGFRIVGAHTDSPNLRVKPNPVLRRAGIEQLGVEPYGGVLLHTWLDRDLGVAGRVVDLDGGEHLVHVDAPVLRIPSLAIHLQRNVNQEGLVLNAQTHLPPVTALSAEGQFSLPELLQGTPSAVPIENIAAWDLMLFDITPATLGGARGEFVFSGRLDNLVSCHGALCALLRNTDDVEHTRVVVLYDHEEVGSRSAHGAGSTLLRSVLERLCGSAESYYRAAAQSWFVSADMAHGEHPNYTEKHEPNHAPLLGRGPVIKVNSNQGYATDALGWALIERCARQAEVDVQKFVVRSDMACGSTVGPISAAHLAMRTVDIGNPMLSMHSCREMCAASDVPDMISLLDEFFAGS